MDTAVHALAVPANVTATACAVVTAVSAPAAPAFVAANRSAFGKTDAAPYTDSVAVLLVAVPTLLVATARY